jgi:hypothetical protein
VKDFDGRRLSIVGASLSHPLLAMSPKVAIPAPPQDDRDQLGEDTTLPRVMPREPDVASVGGSEARPKALNLSAGAFVAVSGQRPDVLTVATSATPVAKPPGWHQEANPPSAASLTMLGGGRSGPSRGQPARRGRPRFWHLPEPQLSLGFVAGRASKSSSATSGKKVVLHSTSRDPPMVCQARVIKLRRKPPAR